MGHLSGSQRARLCLFAVIGLICPADASTRANSFRRLRVAVAALVLASVPQGPARAVDAMDVLRAMPPIRIEPHRILISSEAPPPRARLTPPTEVDLRQKIIDFVWRGTASADLRPDAEADIHIEFVDLNEDGTPEAFVFSRRDHDCGSRGCAAYVLDLSGPDATSLGDFIGSKLEAAAGRTNGWRDILLEGQKFVYRSGTYVRASATAQGDELAVPAAAYSNAANYLIDQQIAAACDGKAGRIDPDSVIERDLTGDGRADLIIHHHGIGCFDAGRSNYCGAQECSFLIYVRRGTLFTLAGEFAGVEWIRVSEGRIPTIHTVAHGGKPIAVSWNRRKFRYLD